MDLIPRRLTGSLLSLSLIYGMCLTIAHHATGSDLHNKTFTKVNTLGLGSSRLGDPWTDQSLSGCALKCLLKYSSQCQTLMYNPATGLCTPGSFLTSGSLGAKLAPNGTEGGLYAPPNCDTNDGFDVRTFGNPPTSVCLKISPKRMNYFDACDYCLNLGAHLYVPRTLEKLKNLPRNKELFIGLNDFYSDGDFKWLDNEQSISQCFKELLFHPGEPNKIKNEDCVVVVNNGKAHFAHNVNCDMKHKFFCERPILKERNRFMNSGKSLDKQDCQQKSKKDLGLVGLLAETI